MPGLVGIIGDTRPADARTLAGDMLATMQHEPTYRFGLHSASIRKTHIGWMCHADSYASQFPVHTVAGDITLILAGEILPEGGHSQAGVTPAHLLEEYERLGTGFLASLNGWYSGAVIDHRRAAVHLFTDRYGMERMFYHVVDDTLYFSSEAKALLRVLPACRDFNSPAVAEFLSAGCTLGEQSLYKGISILPGGSLLTVEGTAAVRRSRYVVSGELAPERFQDHSAYTSSFISRFRQVVKAYSAGAGIGLSLTGGYDSRMVLSAIDAPASTLPCYTFGSAHRETFDVKVSRAVATAARQPHYALLLGPDYVSHLPSYLERAVYIADGYIGLGGAAELHVNAQASRIAPVRLTGNYGSEILRGVRAFKHQPHLGRGLALDLEPLIRDAGATFAALVGLPPVEFAAFHQAPLQDFGRLAIERSQITPRTPFLSNEMVSLALAAPAGLDGFRLARDVIAFGRPELLAIPTDRGYLGTGGPLVRACRHAHRQMLFKAEYWATAAAPRWLKTFKLLRAGLRIEDRLMGRHRFDHQSLWLRTRLRAYASDLLLGDREADLRPYVDRKQLELMLEDHFHDREDSTAEIDRLLTLALAKKLVMHGAGNHASNLPGVAAPTS
jgi:asparagine synthase (glutamine-hydrolysing)